MRIKTILGAMALAISACGVDSEMEPATNTDDVSTISQPLSYFSYGIELAAGCLNAKVLGAPSGSYLGLYAHHGDYNPFPVGYGWLRARTGSLSYGRVCGANNNLYHPVYLVVVHGPGGTTLYSKWVGFW
jgi:hypothetical protein